jgi:hypothetical protein
MTSADYREVPALWRENIKMYWTLDGVICAFDHVQNQVGVAVCTYGVECTIDACHSMY